jgi:hypothetical protein
MVKVSVEDAVAIFEVQGLHKLWALRSRLEVPLAHIRSVREDPSAARGLWKGFHLPGTHVPGVLAAGTFYRGGKRVFPHGLQLPNGASATWAIGGFSDPRCLMGGRSGY